MWYSKIAPQTVCCGYKKVGGYNPPEAIFHDIFGENVAASFTPSLWLWLGKGPAGNEVSQVLSCLESKRVDRVCGVRAGLS